MEERLCDGRHVLVVLDKLGARLYRTQMTSATPSRLEPLINYNHRGEYKEKDSVLFLSVLLARLSELVANLYIHVAIYDIQ